MSNLPGLIARPHNNFFVSQMKDPAHAAGMVRPLLDGRLAAAVGWADMVLEPGSYIDEKPVSYTHLTLPTIYSV